MDELEAAAAWLQCPECNRVRRTTVYLGTPEEVEEAGVVCPSCGRGYPQRDAREIPTQGEDGGPRWTLPRRTRP